MTSSNPPLRTYRLDITVRDLTSPKESWLARRRRKKVDPLAPDPNLIVTFGSTIEAPDNPTAIEKLDPIVKDKWDLAMSFRNITEP